MLGHQLARGSLLAFFFLNINAIKHIRFWASIGNFPRPVPYIHCTQESSSLNLQISMTLFRWHQQSQWWHQGRSHPWLLRCQWLNINYVYRMKFQIINEISWYALALRSLMVWCGPAKSCGTWRAKHPFPLSALLFCYFLRFIYPLKCRQSGRNGVSNH